MLRFFTLNGSANVVYGVAAVRSVIAVSAAGGRSLSLVLTIAAITLALSDYPRLSRPGRVTCDSTIGTRSSSVTCAVTGRLGLSSGVSQ